MRYPREELDAYRKSAGEFENELIDEYREGTVTRRELLQRGSVLGMSLPLLSLVAGVPLATAAPQRQVRTTAGTLRVGSPTADGSLEPPLLQSLGALADLAHGGRAARLRRQELAARAAARDVVEGVEQREDVDVPDPAGTSGSTMARRSRRTTSWRRSSGS